jgi:phosphate transport system permease protein
LFLERWKMVSRKQEHADLLKHGTGSVKEGSIGAVFLMCAAVSILTTIGIVIVLLMDAVQFFREVSPLRFFLGTEWSPTIKPYRYGVLPLVTGTLTFTFYTALVSLPAGLLAAVYLSEYASSRVRSIIKPALEILAGIPTVVYGYFALVYITPALRHTLLPGISTFNVLSASIVVGIMIIPTVASISEDSLRAVPRSLRFAGYGLGVTKWQVTRSVVIPAALSGIVSSFILGISRAIGETMAVTIAAGNLSHIVNPFDPDSLLGPIQTMTAAMVEIGMSDVTGDSTAYRSLFAIGLTLFLMTLLLNIVSQYIKARFREKYQ